MPSEQLLPCPLTSEWRHNNGFIFNGTLRILRADFDTNPSDEFIDEILNWVVNKLNTRVSVPAVPVGEIAKRIQSRLDVETGINQRLHTKGDGSVDALCHYSDGRKDAFITTLKIATAAVPAGDTEICPTCKNEVPINSLLSYNNEPNVMCENCADTNWRD